MCGVIETLGVKEPVGVADEVFVPSVDLVYVGELVAVFDTKELKVLVGLWDCDLVASGLAEDEVVIEVNTDLV
jgi:hypothetical protein